MRQGTRTGQGTQTEQGTQTVEQAIQPDNDRQSGQNREPGDGQQAWRPTDDDQQQDNREQMEFEGGTGEGDRAFEHEEEEGGEEEGDLEEVMEVEVDEEADEDIDDEGGQRYYISKRCGWTWSRSVRKSTAVPGNMLTDARILLKKLRACGAFLCRERPVRITPNRSYMARSFPVQVPLSDCRMSRRFCRRRISNRFRFSIRCPILYPTYLCCHLFCLAFGFPLS